MEKTRLFNAQSHHDGTTPLRLETSPRDQGSSLAAWAIADLAFLLLIAFVAGSTVQSGQSLSLPHDVTLARGAETPTPVKEITLQTFYQPGDTDGRSSFRVVVESVPELLPRWSFVAASRPELIRQLRGTTSRLLPEIRANPDYRFRYIFLSPPLAAYASVLKNYVALQDAIEGDWSVAIYHGEGAP